MFIPRVIPCLLLKNGGLVKTLKFADPVYIGDPLNAVRIFNEFEANELIFIDITATTENRTIDSALVKSIGDEAYMPFAVGGGIRTVEHADSLISSGAEKVVLNTSAMETPALIRQISQKYGNQAVVVALDVKSTDGGYKVFIRSGSLEVNVDPASAAQTAESMGAGEILINSIDRDGTRAGYDVELIKMVSEVVSVPVIALGGADSVGNLREAITDGGASAVAAGSLFVFMGTRNSVLISYPSKEELVSIFHTELIG